MSISQKLEKCYKNQIENIKSGYSSDRTRQKLGRTIKIYLFLCQNCFITKNLF